MTDVAFARAEAIVADLLALPPSARAACLADACGEEAVLRREVESLLALDEAATTFLERPALEVAAADGGAADDPRALVGQQLGDYRVDALIGTGGMADVYRVRHLSLARDEALKVLVPLPGLWAEDRARVEAEARAASRLNHPNIVTIHAVGEAEGLHFIAMELVDGDTLRQRLQAGPLPTAECARLAVQLAEALAAAHAEGIVHCDLKPENIKVTPGGRVKVLDFGIARALHLPGAAGITAGTAGYMAPEQIVGTRPHEASDQYAFGVILAEMLTGRRPPSDRDGVAGEDDSTAGGWSPPAALDPGATAIVRRCLARAPEQRFPSSEALAAACRAWQARVEARGVTRRRVLQSVGAAAVLTASGVGLSRYVTWTSRRRTLAVVPFRSDGGDDAAGYLGRGLASTLIARLGTLPTLAVLPGSLMANFAGDDGDGTAVARRLGADLVLTGDIRRQGQRVRVEATLVDVASGATVWASQYEEPAQALLLVEEKIAQAIVDDGLGLRLDAEARSRLTRQVTTDAVAFDLYLRAVDLCQQETEASYLEARALLERALARDAQFGAGHVQMATTFAVMVVDGLERPTEAWPRSNRHTRLALEATPDAADAHACAASYEFFFNWHWEAAEAEWRAGMRHGGADLHPDLHVARSLQRAALGRLDEALELARQARRLDPVTPMFAVREADFLLLAGDAAAAAAIYDGILHDSPGDVRALFGQAEATRAQGQFETAVGHLRRAYLALGQPDVLDDRLDDDAAECARLDLRGAAAHLAALRERATQGNYVSPLDLARQHARLGQHADAVALFPAALADRAPGLAMLDVDRAWLSMRDLPAFVALRARVGLPSHSRRT